MSFRAAIVSGYSNDPEFVKVMLLSLEQQTVDNFDVYIFASPTTAYYLEDEFIEKLRFKCYHLRLDSNAGFAGNNNFAIEKAFATHPYKYVVLINDDTKPQPNWLKGMIDTAELDSTIGGVTSKMLFYEKFVTLTGKVAAEYIVDDRQLGIRLYNNSRFEDCYYPKRFYRDGFYHDEEDEIFGFRWTKSDFGIEVPVVAGSKGFYTLNLYVRKNNNLAEQVLKLFIDETAVGEVQLVPEKILYEIKIPAAVIEKSWHYIIQNAGSGLTEGYSGFDRGSGEIDKGQYETSQPVEMFCGGSCLLSREALTRTGLFREGLFAYYEDSDLSLRMRKKGFRIMYAPGSVINHYHTGSSKEWSPFFIYHAFRNKIIFASHNFGLKGFLFSIRERWKETWIFFKICVKSRFKNKYYKSRFKMNMVILKDAIVGTLKFKPKRFHT